jgi:hypothetical protein
MKNSISKFLASDTTQVHTKEQICALMIGDDALEDTELNAALANNQQISSEIILSYLRSKVDENDPLMAHITHCARTLDLISLSTATVN